MKSAIERRMEIANLVGVRGKVSVEILPNILAYPERLSVLTCVS